MLVLSGAGDEGVTSAKFLIESNQVFGAFADRAMAQIGSIMRRRMVIQLYELLSAVNHHFQV